MQILLTGATGFIGSHVARALVRGGHRVLALNLPGCSPHRLADVRQDLELVDLDLADTPAVAELVERCRPDACIHLAWYAEPGKYLSSPLNLDCLSQSLHLARALLAAGCPRLLVAGTCVEYELKPVLANAPSSDRLSETSPTQPATLYAASKLALGQILAQLAKHADFSTAWLRFFYLYGPDEDERRLVPAVIRGLLRGERVALTAGTQVRDFLHVEDVASAVVAVLESALVGPVNICSGQPVTVREVAMTIGRLLQREDLLDFGARQMSPDDPPWVVGDNRKLVNGTCWRSRFDLETGLGQAIEWWRGLSGGSANRR